jgi:hypothetical protein
MTASRRMSADDFGNAVRLAQRISSEHRLAEHERVSLHNLMIFDMAGNTGLKFR